MRRSIRGHQRRVAKARAIRGRRREQGTAFAVLGLGAIGALGLALLALGTARGVDDHGCPMASNPHSLTVLVDATDPLPEHAALGRRLRAELWAAQPGTRIRVAELDEVSAGALRPFFDQCLPLDSILRNRALVERERSQVIQAALEAASRKLAARRSTPRSRIVESVARAAVHSEGGDIIVFTDGLENSPLYRAYEDEDGLSRNVEEAGPEVLSALRMVHLRVVMVIRPGTTMARQERAIREFWKPLLKELPTANVETL